MKPSGVASPWSCVSRSTSPSRQPGLHRRGPRPGVDDAPRAGADMSSVSAAVGDRGAGDVVAAAAHRQREAVLAGEADRGDDVGRPGRLDDERRRRLDHAVPEPRRVVEARLPGQEQPGRGTSIAPGRRRRSCRRPSRSRCAARPGTPRAARSAGRRRSPRSPAAASRSARSPPRRPRAASRGRGGPRSARSGRRSAPAPPARSAARRTAPSARRARPARSACGRARRCTARNGSQRASIRSRRPARSSAQWRHSSSCVCSDGLGEERRAARARTRAPGRARPARARRRARAG